MAAKMWLTQDAVMMLFVFYHYQSQPSKLVVHCGTFRIIDCILYRGQNYCTNTLILIHSAMLTI